LRPASGKNFGLLVRRASKKALNDPSLFFLHKPENSTDLHENHFGCQNIVGSVILIVFGRKMFFFTLEDKVQKIL
jgi:hypothetical protein